MSSTDGKYARHSGIPFRVVTSEEFVRGIMERLGVRTAAELAEKMRWKRGVERTAARWLSGDAQPSFGYVMEMIERAELLNASIDGIVRLEPGEDPPAPAERRQLAENDASILANQAAAMEILEEIRVALVSRDEGERTAARRPRRRA